MPGISLYNTTKKTENRKIYINNTKRMFYNAKNNVYFYNH